MGKKFFNQESLIFLKKFFKNYRGIATLFPSSKALARAACKYIMPDKPQTILEVGAGTGAMTRIALEKKHPDSVYIVVEKDPELAAFIARYPKKPTHLLVCDVLNLKKELDKLNINHVDVMISSLPVFNLPSKTRNALFDCYQKLTIISHGVFTQQTLIPWYYQKRYQEIFNQVQFKLVLKNLPPGGIYYCWDLKENYQNIV